MRSAGNEVLVGQTEHSYTYAEPPRQGVGKAVRVEATGKAARAAELRARHARVAATLAALKQVAEGGVSPPSTAAAAPAASLLTPAPHYVSLPMRIAVDAPVDKVWARVGKYCDIGEWGFPGCTLLSGKDGELGAVRSIGTEVLVGQTHWSYIYAQPLRTGGAYTLYHGTLEARPLDPARTTLFYTLLWDNSSEPDEAARAKDLDRRRTLFEGFLRTMKLLCEGGTLPQGALAPR